MTRSKVNRTITSVNLSGNDLRDGAVGTLLGALEGDRKTDRSGRYPAPNPVVAFLDLSGNKFGHSGALTLLEFVKTHPQMVSVGKITRCVALFFAQQQQQQRCCARPRFACLSMLCVALCRIWCSLESLCAFLFVWR